MKKKLSVMTVIILALAICVSAWFYGYYNRKSNDNLPTLTAIAEMSEADVNSLLPGYHIDQLREVWGKPDASFAIYEMLSTEPSRISFSMREICVSAYEWQTRS